MLTIKLRIYYPLTFSYRNVTQEKRLPAPTLRPVYFFHFKARRNYFFIFGHSNFCTGV